MEVVFFVYANNYYKNRFNIHFAHSLKPVFNCTRYNGHLFVTPGYISKPPKAEQYAVIIYVHMY